MHKYSSALKTIGLVIGLGLTSFFFALEALIPGMEGVHWLGMFTFMPGLAIFAVGVVFDKNPQPDSQGNVRQTKPLGKAGRVILTALLLLYALPILYSFLLMLISSIGK